MVRITKNEPVLPLGIAKFLKIFIYWAIPLSYIYLVLWCVVSVTLYATSDIPPEKIVVMRILVGVLSFLVSVIPSMFALAFYIEYLLPNILDPMIEDLEDEETILGQLVVKLLTVISLFFMLFIKSLNLKIEKMRKEIEDLK